MGIMTICCHVTKFVMNSDYFQKFIIETNFGWIALK